MTGDPGPAAGASWRAIFGAAAAVLALQRPPALQAGTVAGFGGATEITQLANNAQLISQDMHQAQMLVNQAEQIANELNALAIMTQNTKQLSGLQWTNALALLNALVQNAQTASNVAYQAAAQDTAFSSFHQTYAQYAAQTPGAPSAATYQAWFNYQQDATNRAANAAGITIAQAQTEQTRIAALKAAGANPQGQVQAVMAGNALAAEMLDQMRALKLLIAQQIDTQSRYMRLEQERDTQAAASNQNVLGPVASPSSTDATYGAPTN